MEESGEQEKQNRGCREASNALRRGERRKRRERGKERREKEKKARKSGGTEKKRRKVLPKAKISAKMVSVMKKEYGLNKQERK